MEKFSFLFAILLLIKFHMGFAQEFWINELMSSNASSITDEDGDNSDWIEFYDGGDAEFNLAGYGLSDDLYEPLKWLFPLIIIKTSTLNIKAIKVGTSPSETVTNTYDPRWLKGCVSF